MRMIYDSLLPENLIEFIAFGNFINQPEAANESQVTVFSSSYWGNWGSPKSLLRFLSPDKKIPHPQQNFSSLSTEGGIPPTPQHSL